MRPRDARQRAFTLIEMALILILFGVILSTTLPKLFSKLSTDKVKKSKETISVARDELLGYAQVNGRLPVEDGTGTVPAVPSGQGIRSVSDSWGSPITYVLPAANATGGTLTGSDICDLADTGMTITAPGATTENVAFIVASKGLNTRNDVSGVVLGGSTALTQLAFGADSTVNAGEQFDDVVQFVTLDYLKSLLDCASGGPAFSPSGADITYSDNMAEFDEASVANPPGQSGGNPVVSIDSAAKTVNLGGSTSTNSGCLWYQGTDAGNGCTTGACNLNYGFRAFFRVRFNNVDNSGDSEDYQSGITFAIIDAAANPSTACGNSGEDNGYGSGSGNTIDAEALAMEIDIVADNPPPPSSPDPAALTHNHIALVYYDNSGETTVAHTNSSGGTKQDFNPVPGSTAIAMPSTSTTPNWLEDGLQHNVRVEVYRNASRGAESGFFNATAWICSGDCSDLTQPYVTQGGDTVIQYNATLGTNSTAAGSPAGAHVGTFDTMRFGWTVGVQGGDNQLSTISDFGIKILKTEPNHRY